MVRTSARQVTDNVTQTKAFLYETNVTTAHPLIGGCAGCDGIIGVTLFELVTVCDACDGPSFLPIK